MFHAVRIWDYRLLVHTLRAACGTFGVQTGRTGAYDGLVEPDV